MPERCIQLVFKTGMEEKKNWLINCKRKNLVMYNDVCVCIL